MIAITGAAGFIGSYLAWKFNQMGREDLLIVDESGTCPPKSRNMEKRKFVDYFEKDDFLKELSSSNLSREVEAIFHMGACTDTTETNKQYLWETNYEYSKRLAEWALANGKRFLYASSAATYGDGKEGYRDDENQIPRLKPLNLYGMSKQAFDLWVLENKLFKKMVGFKLFNVFGPNEYHKGEMRSMVCKGYEQVKKDGKIRLFRSYRKEYADGEQKRDFVYVKDVAEVILWFWDHPDVNGLFNLGAGQAETWNHLARAIFEALGRKEVIEYIEMPDWVRDKYQYWTQADMTKVRKVSCLHTFSSLKDAVKDYIQNYLEKADPYL